MHSSQGVAHSAEAESVEVNRHVLPCDLEAMKPRSTGEIRRKVVGA